LAETIASAIATSAPAGRAAGRVSRPRAGDGRDGSLLDRVVHGLHGQPRQDGRFSRGEQGPEWRHFEGRVSDRKPPNKREEMPVSLSRHGHHKPWLTEPRETGKRLVGGRFVVEADTRTGRIGDDNQPLRLSAVSGCRCKGATSSTFGPPQPVSAPSHSARSSEIVTIGKGICLAVPSCKRAVMASCQHAGSTPLAGHCCCGQSRVGRFHTRS